MQLITVRAIIAEEQGLAINVSIIYILFVFLSCATTERRLVQTG